MTYLKFKKRDNKHIGIWNKEGEYLGALEYIRIGAWMSWVLIDIPDDQIYFSASCLDDIRAKQKELNAKKGKWEKD